MLDRLRSHRILAAIVVIYCFGFLSLGIATSNPQVPLYAGFMALSPFRRAGLGRSGASFEGGSLGTGGLGGTAHGRMLPFVRFDHVVHAIGFGFAGLAFSDALGPKASLALMGGLGFGALNEMLEFLITRVVPDTNIGGFENTGWDLVANTVGATLAALWMRFGFPGRPSG